MHEEYELIQYPLISYLNVFINRIVYRRPHRHDEFEFCLCLAGESRWLIFGQPYQINSGDFLILNPSELHEIRGEELGSTFLFVQFSSLLFSTSFPEIKNLIFDQNIIEDNKTHLNSSLLEFAKQYFMSSQDKPALTVMSQFLDLFDKILEAVPHHYMNSKEQNSYDFRMGRIRRLVDFIEKNYKQNITLKSFAEQENLSLSYASRFIRENLNMSFQDYVRELRFNEAKKLLRNTDISISEISFEAGFSDPRYLNEIFEKNLNMKPSEYRNQNFFSKESTNKLDYVNDEHIFTREESINLLTS
ncbi:MAG: AraC family transcriptional regulator [Clostridiaceae bacterium]|nr:AraC family transcriptional regulator [Clostridiaceae bacterium]